MKRTESAWLPEEQLIITRLNGPVNSADVERWITSLQAALDQVPDGGRFKILVDLDGFKADNFETHKKMRTVIPETLARYGHRVGYLSMFPEAQVELQRWRGCTCVAAVHVHHDETKIRNYDANYASPNERFMTDVKAAEQWIRSVPLH